MVVSEMGPTLSPKIAPLRMAPARNTGSAPSSRPEGYRMGKAVNMVPMEVPVAVAMTQVAMKVKATKPPPDRPILSPSHTKPWATPPRVISLPNMPTISRIRASSFIILEDMPVATASQYLPQFLDSRDPMIRAT